MATGSFTGTGAGTALRVRGKANIALQGTFVGSCVLQRSHDGGTTYEDCTLNGASMVFAAPLSEVIEEPAANGCHFRWNCTAYTSGTINWRISQ